MNEHKTDMLAAVIGEFDLTTVAYVGSDEDFPDELLKRLDKEIEPPGENLADVVYLDDYGPDRKVAIDACFSKVKEGGFLLGSGFLHKDVDTMRAVADSFNLMHVQVGPAGTWCVRK